MLVVGAEHAAVIVLRRQKRHEGLQVPGGGALPDHNELSQAQLGQSVRQIVTLMIGVNPGGDVSIQGFAGQIRGVAVDFFMMSLSRHNFGHGAGVPAGDAGVVHHFGQSLDPGMLKKGVDGVVVQIGARLVQRRRRDAGGNHETHVHRQPLGGLQHVVDAVRPHDVGDFMGIADHCGGTVGQDGPGELSRGYQGALQVDVRVQKTGADDFSAHVGFLHACVRADPGDESFHHGDVGGAQLVGKYVDIGGVFQNQVCFLATGCHFDDALLFLQLPVDFPGVTFGMVDHGASFLLRCRGMRCSGGTDPAGTSPGGAALPTAFSQSVSGTGQFVNGVPDFS